MKKAYISDCEGPISKNDNAFELTAHYLPNGARIFTVISRYDDVLADVLKRPGYKAGDTLKLILPLLKAYGATDREMRVFSSETLVLIPKIKETLRFIRRIMDTFIVSTSYEHYIRALCRAIKFPFKNTYCTRVEIDKYKLKEEERVKLRELAEKVAEMPIIEVPPHAKSLEDFPEEHKRAIQRLDEIFWGEIAKMRIGRIFNEVNPVGGREKAEAVRRIAKSLGLSLSNVVYVGDSITDVEAFKTVRLEGGLTISFNGNEYAVREAEIAVIAENALAAAVLAEVFCKHGKEVVLKLVDAWSPNTLKKFDISPKLINMFLEMHGDKLPTVEIVRKENMERLIKESTNFRKSVRGEAIGRLG
ncbi:MAG: HAD hydrolase family protein [Candidatus Bathyarchaeota archaeon]|nr:HAD hydrolase family protein [Candidatus Bathyarchaeota archaeon]MDW8039896.1 HAD hydrolase family protein [Nitrososphaerota archaeon]